MNAWTQTPTKWYPLPLAVGALLLVAIQYRKRIARAENEVHVNDEGREVIKLKGPWQVSWMDPSASVVATDIRPSAPIFTSQHSVSTSCRCIRMRCITKHCPPAHLA